MTGTKGAEKPEKMSYGEAAARLEEILRQIEEGEVDIDQLSELVREAVGLVSVCRKKIQAAEMQVQTITAELEREAAAEIGESAGLAEAEAAPGAEPA